MKKPPANVIRGLDVLIPAMRIIVEFPRDSELQECSDQQIEDAASAVQWLVDTLNQLESKSKRKS
jgi:hypothetical protein